MAMVPFIMAREIATLLGVTLNDRLEKQLITLLERWRDESVAVDLDWLRDDLVAAKLTIERLLGQVDSKDPK